MKTVFLILITWLVFQVNSVVAQSFTDNRNGRSYRTVQIGNQIWMAENLDVATFLNGDTILEIKNRKEGIKANNHKQAFFSFYMHEATNGDVYGKLYNWFAINDPRGIAPEGWRIPDRSDWDTLIAYIGGSSKIAIDKLKSKSGWIKDGNGTDETGFSALPGGGRDLGGGFAGMGGYGYWWSSTEINRSYAYHIGLASDHHDLYESFKGIFLLSGPALKECAFSVRCVKNE